MYTAGMAMAWLYSNPRTTAAFAERALQAALDKEPKAEMIHTDVNVLLYGIPPLEAYVAVTVHIPERKTAKELLPHLRTPTGTCTPTSTFERVKSIPTGSDCVVWVLGGELWLTILLDDGLLHIVIQPRDYT